MDNFIIAHEGSSTEFETNSTTETPPRMQQYIAMFQTIDIVVICIIVWIFIGLLINGVRKKKWTSTNQNNLDGGMIYTACVVTVASSLPRLVSSLLLFYPDKFTDCKVLVGVGAVTYAIAVCQVYEFLWLRRHAICKHPNVASYLEACYQVTSYVTLIAIFVLPTGALLTYLILDPHAMSAHGCVYVAPVGELNEIYHRIPRAVIGVSVITLQLTLLGLFVYPMWKLRRSTTNRLVDMTRPEKHSNLSTVCDIVALFCLSNSKYDVVSSTIARSITGTVITIVTDSTVAVIVSFIIPDDVPTAVSAALYDFGLLMCIFGVLMTFQDKRKIFFGFCCGTERLPRNFSNVSRASEANSTKRKFNECTLQASTNSLALVEIQ